MEDGGECPSLVVAFEVFDVLKNERSRPVVRNDLRGIKEERALGIAEETVRTTERVFLGNPGKRERLAGKTREQHVVFGNERGVLGIGPDVAGDFMVVGIVEPVGLLALRIPFGREHAATSGRLKAPAKSANSGEKIDEAKAWRSVVMRHAFLGGLPDNVAREFARVRFAALVSIDSSSIDLEDGFGLRKRKPGLFAQSCALGFSCFAVQGHLAFRIRRVSIFDSLTSRIPYCNIFVLGMFGRGSLHTVMLCLPARGTSFE